MVIIILIVLGLLLGSFLTAFVDRLYDGRDWVNGRSACDTCRKELAPRDLVPVFSWVISGGKCRQCKATVHWRYPVTELTTAGLFVFSYHFWPVNIEGFEVARFVWWCVLLVGFMAMSIYDLRWMLIPNRILYPLIGLTIGFIGTEALFYSGGSRLVKDSVLGLIACGGIFYALYQVSKGKWIGGGDVKLGFLLGMVVAGFLKGFLVIMLASFSGVALTLPILITGKLKPKSHIPFGPVLMFACVIVFLFGQQLLDWYLGDLIIG